MKRLSQNFKLLPLYVTYLMLTGQAAVSKLASPGVPEWFTKQFSGTCLNLFNGAIALEFYFIALLEAVLTLGFALSLLRGEFLAHRNKPWLKVTLLGCCVLFAILSVGTRVIGDFGTASQIFIYFATSFALFEFLNRFETETSS